MTMYIVMGIPGSGKSTLARELSKELDAVVASADDFHVWWGRGIYDWKASNQAKAHSMCQQLARYALEQSRNVIVDNTNTSMHEIQIYLDIADYFTSEVYLLEPQTDWRYNLKECLSTNTHGVPEATLQSMLTRIQATKTVIGGEACEVHGHPALKLR